jgi:Domain of Unknown Function (DUF1080)
MLSRRRLMESVGAGGCLSLAGACVSVAAEPENSEGWRNLFNGRDLDGWTFFHYGVGDADRHGVVRISDGVLHFLGPYYDGPQQTMGHIATIGEWENYHLQLQFKWGVRRFSPRTLQRRNSGILYHMGPERDRLFPPCVEFQVEEGDVGDAVMVNTLAVQGPLLGGTPLWPNWIPAIPKVYEPPLVAGGLARQWLRHAGQYESLDDWNTLDLYAFGDQAAHLVNGRIVNTLYWMVGPQAGDARPSLTSGRIALEFEAAEVMFRKVKIRSLDNQAIAQLRAG